MVEPKNKKNEVGFLDEHANKGFENVSAEDFSIPFLKILQPLSSQLDEDAPEFIKSAKSGMFFNTVTERLYGRTVQLIPLRYKKVWLEWLPERGGLVGKHEPGAIKVNKDKFTKWISENGNIIAEHHNFYCLVANHFDEGPIVFSLTSTGNRHAKNWNTQIMMTRLPSGNRAPFFSSIWELETVKNKNDAGSWYMIGDKKTMVKRVRFVSQIEFTEQVLPNRESLDSLKELDYTQIEDNRDITPQKAGVDSDGNSAPY